VGTGKGKSTLKGTRFKTHAQRVARAQALFDLVRHGRLKLAEPTLFALSQGRAAHEHLESGHSMGKVLLMP
jgi:NADPH:quinone reductase-like Zn-dependent oxidoreductase